MDRELMRILDDEVRAKAKKLQTRDLTSFSFHSGLQSFIRALGEQLGYQSIAEYPIPVSDNHHGRIDVVWLQDGAIKLAVEIDSAAKRKSLRKLDTVDAETKVWIFYGRVSKLENAVNEVKPTTAIRIMYLGWVKRMLRRRIVI